MAHDSPSATRAHAPAGGSWGRRCRAGWRIARPLVVAYLAVVALAMIFENSLIYFPARYPAGQWSLPGVPIEDAWFQAADGTRLHGWYAEHKEPRAVVLFCHGNGGNVAYWGDALRRLYQDAGCSVLLFDYRGYGRSEGRPSEAGVLADARAARTWLAQRAGVPPEQIVLMGRSLGGAVAVDLAADGGARALVLESTFSSLPDVAAYHYSWLPVRLLVRTQFDALAKIGRYHGPLLQSHSTADTIVPYQFGRRLFEAANEPKQFLTFGDSDHNDPPDRSYYQALAEFLDRLP